MSPESLHNLGACVAPPDLHWAAAEGFAAWIAGALPDAVLMYWIQIDSRYISWLDCLLMVGADRFGST